MAAFASFYQRIIDPGASQRLSSDRPLAGLGRCRRNTFRRGPLGASIATLGLTCAGTFNAQAANFTCSWNDATANWTTVADWSNCNGTDPNNVGGNTYDVTISTGDPTLTTAVTIGSVTINSPGAWTLSGSGAAAALTGTLTNSGTITLLNGASLTTTTGALNNTGLVSVDGGALSGGSGGSNLSLGGALTNNARATLEIGNRSLLATSTVQAANLSNAGTFQMLGTNATAAAVLTLTGGLTNHDTVNIDNAIVNGGGSTVPVGG